MVNQPPQDLVIRCARCGARMLAIDSTRAGNDEMDCCARCVLDMWREAEQELRAKINAGLAKADQWAAIHGHDQRAATLHAAADDLRTVLGGGS